MNRCTGHCCKVVGLPWSPEHLRASRVAELAFEVNGVWDLALVRHHDGLQIANMLESTGPLIRHAVTGKEIPPGYWGYRCKNQLPNGDCGIYETRPRMCSEYPYQGAPCEWAGHGCTRKTKVFLGELSAALTNPDTETTG